MITLDYTLRTVALGAGALGLVSGALGSFAVLRRQSLLGDAMSHAALPGIALAFIITGAKEPVVLLAGAMLAGWVAAGLILTITGLTRIKEDSALGIVLSVFFGLGLVLLTFIQRSPGAAKAGLDKYLFGQAATLMTQDLVITGGVGLVALVLLALFWKELKLLAFDREFGSSLGLPMRLLDGFLTGLVVLAIVLGLQTVGVVLMSAMIVAPASAARQWTDRLWVMVVLAGLFGAAAGMGGAVLSATATHLPTGPTIVLCMSALVAASLAFAPNRGLLWQAARRSRSRRRLQVDLVLAGLLELARGHADAAHPHPPEVLRSLCGRGIGVERTLAEIQRRGWVARDPGGLCALTPEGLHEAEGAARRREESP